MQNKKILAERKKTHGDYFEFSVISQNLKSAMRETKNWEALSVDKKETLEMLAHKIARILTGDPDFTDHWEDISGYSERAAENVKKMG